MIEVQTYANVEFSEEIGEGGYASVSFSDEHGGDIEIVAADQAGLIRFLREALAVAKVGNS